MKSSLKKIVIESNAFVFLAALFLTGLFYLTISFFSSDSFLRSFFFRCWYVQALTTWLFFTALLFVVSKSVDLKKESRILDTKVSIDQLQEQITPESAQELLEAIQGLAITYDNPISFRRLGELLWGYTYGEEVVRLNQELSRRDLEQIEGGHLILNALKQLIPVLGFLGTVVGLSLGMAKFPELSETAGNIEALRTLLKDLAASLSVSFDTTLLALGYTIIVVMLSSLLRRKEELFVDRVDEKARVLISRLSHANPDVTAQPRLLEAFLRDLLQKFLHQLDQAFKQTVQKLEPGFTELIHHMEGLQKSLNNPPRYEIVVQPLEGNRRERQ
ncbi:MotA/TolQ/ExbB proton channel family protein [Desulfobacca acetoxidans]|uniref:MotA/TolQ/ExbB proton channel domain-containing protein n=1 Tax=Desulfobacca acetoxidans (strain ATCC 700848 / DSM 11109 / ASRB2) TaxID=880072 RepID=F2NIX5_DESAR|nr:MotA/TolQ/ExbB proton channel family protein [Desulfobacca acetoxidans]AEB10740.1 hypothetical protein Desac_2941 [Desulfobacca acetoxidans DSM 11109]HAY21815.1 hypothetical protein [Desulfobacterales bacterium]